MQDSVFTPEELNTLYTEPAESPGPVTVLKALVPVIMVTGFLIFLYTRKKI